MTTDTHTPGNIASLLENSKSRRVQTDKRMDGCYKVHYLPTMSLIKIPVELLMNYHISYLKGPIITNGQVLGGPIKSPYFYINRLKVFLAHVTHVPISVVFTGDPTSLAWDIIDVIPNVNTCTHFHTLLAGKPFHVILFLLAC